MIELKTLSKSAIPAALAQAERYRLLNEPTEAESICLDILRIDPEHQEAIITMVLALTDEFREGRQAHATAEADKAVARISDEYKRLYYTGIVKERRGKAVLRSDRPGSGSSAHAWLREAMTCYERAEAIRPAGNDEAVLRWNTCARLLMSTPAAEPDVQEFSAIQSE
jgi:tetratricopeptide (TPR) repeat protein